LNHETEITEAMTSLTYLTIGLYLLSSAGYLLFLFIQQDRLHHFGRILLISGCAAHSALILLAFFRFGSLPAHNLHQSLVLAGWTISTMYVILNLRFGFKMLGLLTAPLSAMILIAASRFPLDPQNLQPGFKNLWVIGHVLLVMGGEAAFALACGAGILYLIQEQAIKTKKRGFFYRRLPSLEFLDSAGYTCIIAGFTLLTIGLIGGFVYAKALWGRFWGWDPKEIWSGVVWLFYAALLHERLTVGWRGRKSAIMSIIGFVAIVFTFLGVNLLMEGHHRPFTQ